MTSTEVKTLIPQINSTIEEVLINSTMLFTQDTLIKNSIGQQWYEEIILQISGGTTTAENLIIINNYLKSILAFGTWQNLIINLSLQTNDAGLRIKLSEHSQAAESKDLSFMRDYIQDFIDSKRKEMYRYIKNNQSSYTLYYNDKYGDKPINNIYDFKIGGVPRLNNNLHMNRNYNNKV